MGWTAGSWAVGEGPKATPEEARRRFLESGRQLVDRVLARAEALGLAHRGNDALDVGCGPGRLSRALADRYLRVVGVDIAPAMIDLARTLTGLDDRCTFKLIDEPDLRAWPDDRFDLVLSAYVVQHLPFWLASSYLTEMVRVTRPGGTLVVQFHGGIVPRILGWLPQDLVAEFRRWLRRRGVRHRTTPLANWDDYWIEPETVRRILTTGGAEVIAVEQEPDRDGRMVGYWAYARRTGPAPDRTRRQEIASPRSTASVP